MGSRAKPPLRYNMDRSIWGGGGGLDLPDLRTEMGIAQLKLLRNAIFAHTEVGKLILISLKYSQIEAGISQHLMEHPNISISYLSPTWLLSIRQYMYQHNLALTFSDQLQINYQGQHDRCIMQQDILKRYNKQQQWDINLVRLHLQVLTLSDISTADGKQITQQAYNGTRKAHHRIRLNWPRQSKPKSKPGGNTLQQTLYITAGSGYRDLEKLFQTHTRQKPSSINQTNLPHHIICPTTNMLQSQSIYALFQNGTNDC